MSHHTGVNIEAIRYYEHIGIIPKPDRTDGGNRQYNHAQLKRLSFVKRCRELGFALNEVRALLETVDGDDFTCNEVHDITPAHLANVKKKLIDLNRLERVLTGMVCECSKGDMPECPIIDTLFDLA